MNRLFVSAIMATSLCSACAFSPIPDLPTPETIETGSLQVTPQLSIDLSGTYQWDNTGSFTMAWNLTGPATYNGSVVVSDPWESFMVNEPIKAVVAGDPVYTLTLTTSVLVRLALDAPLTVINCVGVVHNIALVANTLNNVYAPLVCHQ
jgi:hypothetical protein